MTTTVQAQQGVATWPLARRVVSGLVAPGGARMAARAVEGAGIDDGSRVVELAPGLGLTAAELVGCGPRSWTGVEPDALAAGHLARGLGGAGRAVVQAPVDATGLETGAASAVVATALLSTLTADGRAATLAEGARLLRAGGRVAVIDVAPAPAHEADADLREALAAVGVDLLSEGAWRAAAEAAGLVVVGATTGPLRMPAQHELMRQAGPRTALKITREVAGDAAVRGPALKLRQLLDAREVDLRAIVVVAEVPLVLGMRRPRR